MSDRTSTRSLSPASSRPAILALSVAVAAALAVPAPAMAAEPPVLDIVDEWPLPHQDERNHRAVPDPLIDSSTVGQLEVAWTRPTAATPQATTPSGGSIIDEGVVYTQGPRGRVAALVLETGEPIWERDLDAPLDGPAGPAIDGRRVFVSFDDATFGALDIATGDEVWSIEAETGHLGGIQPLVHEDTLYYATRAGGSEEDAYAAGESGVIHAVDPASGAQQWTFQVVEDGFWGEPDVNAGGGVRYPPAVGEESGVTYWGTGAAAPFPGTEAFPNGSSHPGPDPHAASLVALDAADGTLSWHHPAAGSGLFGHGLGVPPILAELEIAGEPRELVIGAGSVGDVVAVDAASGQEVWRTEVGIHRNDTLEELPVEVEVEVYPGILGGVATPMAYADGTLYVPVVDVPTTHTATGHGAADAAEAYRNALERTPLDEGAGAMVAIDAATGDVVWQRGFESPLFGAATVSGDLVFTATRAGVMHALDRASGEPFWAYRAPAGIMASPAIAQDSIVWAASVGDDAQLLALRLGAASGDAAADDTGADAADPAAEDAAPDDAAPDDAADTVAQEPDASWPPPGPRRVVDPPAGVDPRPQNIEPERAEPPEGGPGVAPPRPAAEDVIEERAGTDDTRTVATAAPVETPSPPPAGSPAPEQPAAPAENGVVELTIIASDLAWDRDELRVPAAATVRLTVVNRDRTPHDFALYRSEAAEELLFSGERISGPDVRRTYEFAAPAEPGEYFYRCELHPERMTGAFIVE